MAILLLDCRTDGLGTFFDRLRRDFDGEREADVNRNKRRRNHEYNSEVAGGAVNSSTALVAAPPPSRGETRTKAGRYERMKRRLENAYKT